MNRITPARTQIYLSWWRYLWWWADACGEKTNWWERWQCWRNAMCFLPFSKSPYDRVYECTPSTFEIGTTLAGCSKVSLAENTPCWYNARELN